MKIRKAQSSFSLGEFSPLLAARSDLAQYANGAARLLNRRLLAQGGTDTRPGLRFVKVAPQPACRLLPYFFSQTQLYLLQLTNNGMAATLPDGTECTGFTGAPWTTAQLPEIRFCQNADTLLLFHPAWAPQRIQRTSSTVFVRDTMPVEYAPFDRFAQPQITVTPSGGSGSVTLAFDTALWTAAVVGEQIQYKGRRLTVTAFTNATTLTASWADTSTGITVDASTDWQEQSWSTRRGWPLCGTFHDGRLAIGGTDQLPNTVWISRAGAFFNWQTGVNDGDAIAEVAAANQSGRIQHLFSASRLLAMTDSATFAFYATGNGTLTPKTVSLRRIAEVGASRLAPAEVDSAVLFLDQTKAVMREIEIDESTNRTTANPVSLLSNHLVRQPTAMTVLRGNANRPEIYAALVTADGTLITYHSLRQERVTAWVEWDTAGRFRDVCAVGPDLFVLTERNGAWRIERFDEAAAPIDCASRVTSGTKTKTFAGFTHLAGQTVAVVTRGHDLGNLTVSPGGVITLTDSLPEVFEVEAGFRFTQIIRPMPADHDLPAGQARGLRKRLLRVFIQVDGSGQVSINGRPLLLTFQGDDFDNPPIKKTGVISAKMLGTSIEAQADVQIVGAEKVTVLGMTRELAMDDPANEGGA